MVKVTKFLHRISWIGKSDEISQVRCGGERKKIHKRKNNNSEICEQKVLLMVGSLFGQCNFSYVDQNGILKYHSK